jgi:hypothetical protein
MSLSTLPTLKLTMNASEWNKVFAFGTNIYRTYSSQLPILDNHTNSETLATEDLDQTNIIIEPEETDQTIADNVIRTWVKQITGVQNQTSLFSNIAIINAHLDTLLTSSGNDETHLVYKLKASLDNANGLTDQNTGVNNITRNLKTQLEADSGSSNRLTTNTGQIYHTDNILSNLLGDLSGITMNSQSDGTITSGLTFVYSGTATTNATISHVTIRDEKLAGVRFSDAGSGYTTGQTIRVGIDSTFYDPYTIETGDLDGNGGFSKKLYNFLFINGDSIAFQLTMAPKANSNLPQQTSKNYAIQIEMI